MYEFVQKLAKKKKKKEKKESWDFNPGPIWLAIVAAAPPPPSVPILFIVRAGCIKKYHSRWYF